MTPTLTGRWWGVAASLAFVTVVAIYAFRINHGYWESYSYANVTEPLLAGEPPDRVFDDAWRHRFRAYGLTNQLIVFAWFSAVGRTLFVARRSGA